MAKESVFYEKIKHEETSKLEKIQQQILQLQKKKKALQAEQNEKIRKARVRRLIQIGAIAIKYLGCPTDIEPVEFENVVKSFASGIAKKA